MEMQSTALFDVKILRPKVFEDSRGFFLESYNQNKLETLLGFPLHFVQDNHSRSSKGVLRGLHYQVERPQGKLVRVTRGKIFDVAVDLRKHSPDFGKAVGVELSDENYHMLYIPPGFAHGFLVLSDIADMVYKVTDYYHPESERTLLWNDSTLGIKWPLEGSPILSPKDEKGRLLKDADVFTQNGLV
jgi:dTDP-4-dehydrorhamnose 3,5-epimerase